MPNNTLPPYNQADMIVPRIWLGNKHASMDENFLRQHGIQTVFSILYTPTSIYINGVYQNKNTYTVLGNSVVFTQAPPITSIIEFVF